MRSRTLLLILPLLVLSACQKAGNVQTLDEHLTNPLFAERYAESVVDRLVELEIVKDPLLEDPAKKAYLDAQRKRWLEVTRDARAAQREGTSGNFISMGEFAKGEVLYARDTLSFDSLFEVDPLPSLHVFLTTVVDPRDVSFPDETALDLGPLGTPFGAQQYSVPPVENPLAYRTVVLWETKLERLHSFAQLNK
jgi:hypothetical protein